MMVSIHGELMYRYACYIHAHTHVHACQSLRYAAAVRCIKIDCTNLGAALTTTSAFVARSLQLLYNVVRDRSSPMHSPVHRTQMIG